MRKYRFSPYLAFKHLFSIVFQNKNGPLRQIRYVRRYQCSYIYHFFFTNFHLHLQIKRFFFFFLVPSDDKLDPNEAISPSKRRLVLSTNLMQQLLQPAPPFVFSGNNAAFNCEILLYFGSRVALGDACSLRCHSDLDKSKKWVTLWN